MSRAHRWSDHISRRCHWQYCTICGLVAAKNKASRKAADRECPGESRVRVEVLSPGEIRQLKKLDKLIWE